MSDHIDVDKLRESVHMKMLSQSKNANDCGDLTVVPLGFAVSIAADLIASQRKEAEYKAAKTIGFRLDDRVDMGDTAAVYWEVIHAYIDQANISEGL